MEHPPIPGLPVPRRRSGAGCLVQVLAALALCVVLVFGIDALLAPWAFYMGGHFHIYPGWTGWGQMHSKIAGDYALYVNISPRFSRYGRGEPHVSGTGRLCTQHGDMYRLRVGGDFEKRPGSDLQGRKAYIYANHYSPITSSTAPSIEFRGKWNNPDLVMDDHGSINRAFDPGGVLAKNSHMRPYMQEVVPLTLHEGSYSDFEAACAALKGK